MVTDVYTANTTRSYILGTCKGAIWEGQNEILAPLNFVRRSNGFVLSSTPYKYLNVINKCPK